MDIALVIAAVILLVAGFLGTFLPVIPGPPLAWLGLLAANFSSYSHIGIWPLIITGIVAAAVTILDNVFPAIFTKRSGGSKAATIGSTIGLIAGIFVGPLGIIAGPFIGAFIGELIYTNGQAEKSLKSAWGAFLGFLFGTGLKMITVLAFICIFVWKIVVVLQKYAFSPSS